MATLQELQATLDNCTSWAVQLTAAIATVQPLVTELIADATVDYSAQNNQAAEIGVALSNALVAVNALSAQINTALGH